MSAVENYLSGRGLGAAPCPPSIVDGVRTRIDGLTDRIQRLAGRAGATADHLFGEEPANAYGQAGQKAPGAMPLLQSSLDNMSACLDHLEHHIDRLSGL